MKPDTFEEAYARIQAATQTKTQTEIANILGIKQSSISDAKKKNTIPDGWLLALYRGFGLEPDWILYGQQPVTRREHQDSCSGGVRESAGTYAAPPARISVFAMDRTDPATGRWLRENLETIPLIEPLARPALIVVKMDNASMEPAIRRNAYIGLDNDDTRLRSGEIYALDLPGEGLVIRRIVRNLERKRLLLLADNPTHHELDLPLDDPDIVPVGKAVWIIQEI